MTTCVFVQLRCEPGKTYEVADAVYDREFASELYSTSGDYDLHYADVQSGLSQATQRRNDAKNQLGDYA